PETFISINSALQGIPEFGLGTLLGSNVADLTLVFAIVIFGAGRQIKIENKLLKNLALYPLFLLVPLLLGLDGFYSRVEGLILIFSGFFFYALLFREDGQKNRSKKENHRVRNFIYLVLSMAGLLLGAHFTVTFGAALAETLNVTPILVALLVVGLGTTLPEMFFSLKAVRARHDNLATGDLLGTVLTDATIIVGILALVKPFSFPQQIVYVTGSFMVIAAIVLLHLMRGQHRLGKKEAFLLLLFYIIFVFSEFALSQQVD
ncbi:MAG: hypothetical protein AAB802_03415, partial [Patescibacteria group bacterium]